MFFMKKKGLLRNTILLSTVFAVLVSVTGCGSSDPEWKAVNDQIIAERNIQERHREDIPQDNPVVSNLEEGVVNNIDNLQEVELAAGVTAKMYWSKGNLVAWVDMAPGAEIAEETLPGERVMVVWEGSVEQLIDGQNVEMVAKDREVPTGINGGTPHKDFVILEEGAQNAVRAGENGARILEVYWPVRLDYLAKAGIEYTNVPKGDFPVPPSHQPNVVYNLYDMQWTELVPGANSRIISGHGAQLSFIRMDSGSYFDYHNHPEAQVMISLRGWIDEIILDGVTRMEAGACLYLPAFMVHGGTNGPFGCDALDVFYPPREDYDQSRRSALAKYNEIIPEDSEVELIIDGATDGPGLTFTEGPAWVNGKLYFSSMFFTEDWNADPSKSTTVEMDPDGAYRYIQQGLQTNGIMPMANGHLAVCDMLGHRIVEMTTSGRVVRTLASEYNGKRLDGPNDLVIDAKGGIYFTDPQFTPGLELVQPGRQVFYRKPNGEVILIAGVGEFGQPNGLILSPDGKTLYVDNTFHDANHMSDVENYVVAYDVNDDGTVSNKRQHGALRLTAGVLDAEDKSTSADGMTIDTDGNIYVATFSGVQILSAEGIYIGTINTPVFPVSVAFGDEDMKTLYITAYDKIYKVRTNKTGVIFPLGS